MILRPFFTYFGAKWRVAPYYPPPIYDTVIEPLAGAAGYSLRHHTRAVILIERDPVVAATWRYLLRATPEEILRLPDVLVGAGVPGWVPEDPALLIRWWLNKGSAQPKRTMSRWAAVTPGAVWGEAIRQRIARQLPAIRHWTLIEGSYADVPNTPATWFVDPPYQVAGRHYRCGAEGIDYGHLGAWCRTRQGQVIVCENEGADWLPFRPWRTIKAREGRRMGPAVGAPVVGGTSKEVVWVRP